MGPDDEKSGAGFLMVLAVLALLLQFVLLALAPGCAHAPPVPPPIPEPRPPLLDGVDRCYTSAWPTDLDVCEGKFTPSGLACVRCEVQRPCVLDGAEVYCTPACSDPYCGSEP